MRLLIPLLLLILSGCLTPAALKDAESAKAMGYAYLGEGNTPGAVAEFRGAVKNNKWDSDAWHGLALAYFAAEMHADAEAAFLEAIKLADNSFPQAHVNLGSLYLETQQWDKAVETLSKAVADPEYRQPSKARHNLGWAFYNQGQYAEARREYQKVLREFPLFCPAVRNLGMVDEAEGKLKDAMVRYQQAQQCDPTDLNVRLSLGTVEARLDLRGDACGNLVTVRDADPYGELATEASRLIAQLECEGSAPR